MIDRTNATGQADKGGGDKVADPHTEPRMPPRKAITGNHGGSDHPSINVERVGNPESWWMSEQVEHSWKILGVISTNIVPRTPLSSFRFNRFQIVVREHELGIREARL